MQDKNPLAHYSGVLSEAAQESAGVPDQAQIKTLMRKHRIWIEHSTLFEDDLPARELRAVQAEQHQFEAFVQDLIALSAAKTTPENDYLEGVSIPNLREALIFLGRENGVGEGEVGDKLAQYVNSVVSGVLSKKAALREAPQAAPAAVAGPDGWKLVPVDLMPEMKREFMDLLMDGIDIYVNRRDQIEIQTDAPRRIWKAVLALAPSAPADALATATGLPAQAVPAFCHVASLKLKSLQERGYQITGYALEKPVEGAQPERGFINHGGFVGWWWGGQSPQAQADARDAEQYRLLQRGQDTIQADDEFLREDGVTWRKDPSGIFVGVIYEGNILLPARRAIAAQAAQGGDK